MYTMRKVIVIGCPGSGKSTFARKLRALTGLPLYHLDMMYWNEDKTTVEREVFDARLKDAMAGSTWIIDGNYARTMEIRLAGCDTVFFLDYPTEVCLEGIESRKGKSRSDMPWTENSSDDEFVSFVKNYNENNRPEVIKLLEKYSDKNIFVFHSRAKSEKFLSELSLKGNAL